MKNISRSLLMMALMLSAGIGAAEETVRYVNDYIVITVRSGPGDQYRVLDTLRSGDKIVVQEELDEFVRIVRDNGEEGWVRKQYLVDEPVARDKLIDALKRLERVTAENKQLKANSNELGKTQSGLAAENERLVKENRKLGQENTRIKVLSEKPLELDEENQRLKAEAERINKEIAELRERNHELEMSSIQKWFMAGSGVLLFGIILGIILPRMGGRKRSGWM